MADDFLAVELSLPELREVTGYAAACAWPALEIFERERPGDRRPRAALDAAQAFADGGPRVKALRDNAWASHRAAQEARDQGQAAASAAARAAAHACGAAFLHPLAKATQVSHILGSARALALADWDGRRAVPRSAAAAERRSQAAVSGRLRRRLSEDC